MRLVLFALAAAIGLTAHPAAAQTGRSAAQYWKSVQAICDTAAARPASALGRRIAQTAIDEAAHFGGHRIDADGRLFRFGLTEAEHNEEGADNPQERLGDLGWRQVLKYWRTLYGDEALNILEVRGYEGGSTSDDADVAKLIREDAGPLLRAAEGVSDPVMREIVREAILRAAIIDTPWSAAFVSYVLKQSGAATNAFDFAFAHRVYIYDAFATSAAEAAGEHSERLYRACPLDATRPRAGDLICFQRDPELADATAQDVRERIRSEVGGPVEKRTLRNTHCEVIAHIDARARRMYTVGGNVSQAVTVRQLKLKHGLKFASQRGNCDRGGRWTLPQSSSPPARGAKKECSLNDRKWFVLLQLRQ